MKNLSLVLALLLFMLTLVLFSCKKQELNNDIISNLDNTVVSKGSTTGANYTNPDPTWTQVTSPILMPATWNAQFVPLGYTAGLPTPNYSSTGGKVIVQDATIVIKWHLHVGLRNFNSQLKPDVVDYRSFYINGLDTIHKAIPNRGGMGDYDFIDTIKISRNGYYNFYNLGAGYNWNGITPYVHSSATNTFINNPFFVGIPQ